VLPRAALLAVSRSLLTHVMSRLAAVQTIMSAGETIRFECPGGMDEARCSFLEWQIAASAHQYWANFQSTYSMAALSLRAGQGYDDAGVHFYG
jgi:hypothetical protein